MMEDTLVLLTLDVGAEVIDLLEGEVSISGGGAAAGIT